MGAPTLDLLALARLPSVPRSGSVFAACGLRVALFSFLFLRFSLPPLVVHCGFLVQLLPQVLFSRLLLLCDRPGCLTLCQVCTGPMCPCSPSFYGTKGFGRVWGFALFTMLRGLFLAHNFPASWNSLLRSRNPFWIPLELRPCFFPPGAPVLPSPALPSLVSDCLGAVRMCHSYSPIREVFVLQVLHRCFSNIIWWLVKKQPIRELTMIDP